MNNTLLQNQTLPVFSQIKTAEIKPSIDKIITENRAELKKLLKQTHFTWDNLIMPLEDLDDHLQQAFSPIEHLNAVMNTDEIREAYNSCLPELTEYHTEVAQNEDLYKAIQSIADSDEFKSFDQAQKQTIKHAIRDFKLSGIALDQDKKARFAELQKQLSELTTKFENNLMDATDAWTYNTNNEAELAGLPEHVIQAAKEIATDNKQAGWTLKLDLPTYFSVLHYADNAGLRKTFYEAYSTRASDQGPNAGKWDNSKIMEGILNIRQEEAELLGFNNYAELSLASKMAKDTKQVVDFLQNLGSHAKPFAEKELQTLKDFAKKEYGIDDLKSWDLPYFEEKLRQHLFSISTEELRPYFPEPVVMNGMFNIVKQLYGIDIKQLKDVDVWHKDAKCYGVYKDDNLIGVFYTDLYARPNKRGGAWMGECQIRRILSNGKLQLPVAYLTCNFTAPAKGEPCLLTHDEVVTVFHEFGHTLHHLLTTVDYASVSGINGVPWDAVELPSKFMENWCWEMEALPLISKHYKTGETLPKVLLDKMLAAKNFDSGLMMLRQLEFSLFDFYLHMRYKPGDYSQIQKVLDNTRKEVAVITPPAFNRFQHGFSHIFAGGYGAGYYSYKWAEVLSSDAFSKFEEDGIFNQTTGKSFLENILQKGGSFDAMDLFKNFRGREPKVDSLLRHSGLT